tara:strand:- start:102 stop:479 length:378 start_codon:yes stop_codon:yes gene_type:complete
MSFDSDYRPPLQPPDWVFGPVWAFLYTSLAISIVLSFRAREEIPDSNFLFACFALNMALNFTWSGLFNSEQYLLSTLTLVGIIIFTSIYAYGVYDQAPLASILVWPYIAWVSFATLLNIFYLVEA